jgi:hypothetical protein
MTYARFVARDRRIGRARARHGGGHERSRSSDLRGYGLQQVLVDRTKISSSSSTFRPPCPRLRLEQASASFRSGSLP